MIWACAHFYSVYNSCIINSGNTGLFFRDSLVTDFNAIYFEEPTLVALSTDPKFP